jgi:hypothetical protein
VKARRYTDLSDFGRSVEHSSHGCGARGWMDGCNGTRPETASSPADAQPTVFDVRSERVKSPGATANSDGRGRTQKPRSAATRAQKPRSMLIQGLAAQSGPPWRPPLNARRARGDRTRRCARAGPAERPRWAARRPSQTQEKPGNTGPRETHGTPPAPWPQSRPCPMSTHTPCALRAAPPCAPSTSGSWPRTMPTRLARAREAQPREPCRHATGGATSAGPAGGGSA